MVPTPLRAAWLDSSENGCLSRPAAGSAAWPWTRRPDHSEWPAQAFRLLTWGQAKHGWPHHSQAALALGSLNSLWSTHTHTNTHTPRPSAKSPRPRLHQLNLYFSSVGAWSVPLSRAPTKHGQGWPTLSQSLPRCWPDSTPPPPAPCLSAVISWLRMTGGRNVRHTGGRNVRKLCNR